MRHCFIRPQRTLKYIQLHLARFSSNMESNYSNLLLVPDASGYSVAANLIKSGKLVAFPTETVYGLGANALDADAVLSIFTAKGRPLTDPVIIHVADQNDSYELVDLQAVEIPVFKQLTQLFWPGPLTLIAKASSKIPPIVTANTGFVSVRYPNHPIACRLIRESGLPIAAPSANRFGHVSPTRAVHVLADLGIKRVHVLSGESDEVGGSQPCEFGIESTVAKIDGANKQIIIFRQGAVTQQQLENAVSAHFPDWSVVAVSRTVNMHKQPEGEEQTSSAVKKEAENTPSQQTEEECVGQEAPGQAVTHYAPDVPCFVVRSLRMDGTDANAISEGTATSDDNVLNLPRSELHSGCVVLDYNGALSALSTTALAYRDLSATGSASEAAHGLFDSLRWAELVPGAGKVLVASIAARNAETGDTVETDLTLGVADRVFRAASGQFLNLNVV